MPKFVGERDLRTWDEGDGGRLRVAQFDLEKPGDEDGLYVELCSYYDNRLHEEWEQLRNKQVRITVETVD